MLASVDALELLRLSEKAMPTMEKRRSTDADDAGQPKYYCRAIRAKSKSTFYPTSSPTLAPGLYC
jgi:hypothetical protein